MTVGSGLLTARLGGSRVRSLAAWLIAWKRLPVLAALSAIVVVIVSMPVKQGLHVDPTWQVRAAQQYVQGVSPSPNALVTPDPADLSRTRAWWIYWWAPGTQLLITPLLQLGLAPGNAVRWIAVLSLILGAVGWAKWFRKFELPPLLAVTLAVGIPWIRYANAGLFRFSADTLVFAVAPWALLIASAVSDRWREQPRAPGPILMFTVGAVLGFPYLLKYSAILPLTGAVAFVALCAVARWHPRVRELLARGTDRESTTPRVPLPLLLLDLFALAIGFSVFVLGLTILNRKESGTANLVTAGRGFGLHFDNIVAVLANPALAAADAQQLLYYTLLHPGRQLVSVETMRLAGLPGAALLWWLLSRKWPRTTAEQLAIAAFLATVASMTLIYAISTTVDTDARHVAAGALSVLPLVLSRGLAAARESTWRKLMLVSAATFYLLIPLLFGAAAVVGKERRDRAFITGTSGFRNALLSTNDIPSCQRDLLAGTDPSRDMWYVWEAGSLMDLPSRTFVEIREFMPSDFTPISILRTKAYRTSRPLTIHVVLPPTVESEGRGVVIRDAFKGAGAWTAFDPPHCTVRVWTTRLAPTSN
jgi:hypothetical protein